MESEKPMSDPKEEKKVLETEEDPGEITDVHETSKKAAIPSGEPDTAVQKEVSILQESAQTKPTRTPLGENRPETAVLASTRLRRSGKGNVSQGTISFGDQRELILVIRGIVERIVLPEDQSVVLGRSDARLRYRADIDLTPYGALDRGVSREHARVYTEEGLLYIVDMSSTNGTFLSGKRLEPNVPTLLHKGDELLLGRLPVQILFR